VQRWFARHVDTRQAKALIEVFGAVEQDLRPGK